MTIVTLRPDATIQLGNWTVVGAANAHTALLDALDTSYIQIIGRAQLDSQIIRLSVDNFTLPTNAKIFSVRSRIRVQQQSVGQPAPDCTMWHRTRLLRLLITVIVYLLFRKIIHWTCPVKEVATEADWVEQDLGAVLPSPEGGEWTQDSFNDYEIHMGRNDTGTNPVRISAWYIDVEYYTGPTIALTYPTGTITDKARPPIDWTYTDPQSDRQQAFWVKIFSQAQTSAPGFDVETSPTVDDSGWVQSQGVEWVPNVDFVNGTYTVYLKVQKIWAGQGTFETAWTSATWTQNVAGAPDPVISSAVFERDTNRVRITATPSSGSPATVAMNFEVSRDGGINWIVMYGGLQVPVSGTSPVTVFDYGAPLNQQSRYRAVSYRQVGSLRYPSNYSSETSAIPLVSNQIWAKSLLAPALNMPLPINNGDESKQNGDNDKPSRPASYGVFTPLVDPGLGLTAYKIVVSGPSHGREGVLTLMVTDDDVWDAFNALYDSKHTLLLQYTTGEQFYFKFLGDLDWYWSLRGDKAQWRLATVSYVEQKPLEG